MLKEQNILSAIWQNLMNLSLICRVSSRTIALLKKTSTCFETSRDEDRQSKSTKQKNTLAIKAEYKAWLSLSTKLKGIVKHKIASLV